MSPLLRHRGSPAQVYVPSADELQRGIREFESREPRDAMYKVATFLVTHFWGRPADMADGLGVLLLTWNQGFYRYGQIDFADLESCITRNLQQLDVFRRRTTSHYLDGDRDMVKDLFLDMLDATKRAPGPQTGSKSPVAVAKALHVLAPHFFPIWDRAIANAYLCSYDQDPAGAYADFSQIMTTLADVVSSCVSGSSKSLLKLIDEYNYSKYTKGWV